MNHGAQGGPGVPGPTDPDDDEAWLHALAGRPSPAGSRATQAEALLWRQAQQRATAVAPRPPLALPELQGLLDRAQAQGLLQARRSWCPACLARWQRWLRAAQQPWGGAGWALASVLFAALVLALVLPAPPDDAPAMRGPDAPLVVRTAPDPSAAREQLAQLLQRWSVQPRQYQRLGRLGLDADLPQPMPAGLAQALQAQGLSAAGGTVLRVEFEAGSP
jgi:hypothetical protein